MDWRVEKLSDFMGAAYKDIDAANRDQTIMVSPADSVWRGGTSSVVVSRLPIRWNSEDLWLSSVRRAVERIRNERWTLVGSIGSAGWEYILWYAGQLKCNAIIVLPPTATHRANWMVEQTLHALELERDRLTFFAPVLSSRQSKEEALRKRDNLICLLSEKILPTAVRNGGYWDSICSVSPKVSNEFRVSYPLPAKMVDWSKSGQSSEGAAFPWNDYFVHLTRGSYKPWQGELKSDYFRALTENRFGNPRDELATLVYILTGGILRGSGNVIRQGLPVVSFSTLNPYFLIAQSVHSSRLHSKPFQPFGFAIPKKLLIPLGVKPVIYGSEEIYEALPSSQQPFFQARGDIRTSGNNLGWGREEEYRLIGDLDLDSLGNSLVTLVPNCAAGKHIPGRYRGEILPLFAD